MSEIGSGPVLVIQNIENVCLGTSAAVKLSCHAGVAALSDISNSENMNVNLIATTMKRPLPNDDDDELVEVKETKKVKLVEHNEEITSAGILNGNHCDEEDKIEGVTEESAQGLEKSVDEIVKTNGVIYSESSVEKSSNGDSNVVEDSTLEDKIVADVGLVEANGVITNSESSAKVVDEVSNVNQENEENCIKKHVNVNSEAADDENCEITREKNDGDENILSEAPMLQESHLLTTVEEIKGNSIGEPAVTTERYGINNSENSLKKDFVKNNVSEAPVLETKVADELSTISKETKENFIDEPIVESERDVDSNSGRSVLKNEAVENNISEAPTLKVVSDKLVNINEKIDLCDNSNSNNVDIKLCLDKTASVSIVENSTNPPKTETTHVEIESNVEEDILQKSRVDDVSDKDALSPDLVKNIQNKECSSSSASLPAEDNIEPSDEVNDKCGKEDELSNQCQEDQNENADKVNDSINEKTGKHESEKECAEPTESKSGNMKLEDLDKKIKNVLDTVDPLDVKIKLEVPEIEDEPIISEHQEFKEETSENKETNSNGDSSATEIKNDTNEVITSAHEKPSDSIELILPVKIIEMEESKDTVENNKSLPCAEVIAIEKEIEEKMDTDEIIKITSCAEEMESEVSDGSVAKKVKLDVLCEKVLEDDNITEDPKESDEPDAKKLKLDEPCENVLGDDNITEVPKESDVLESTKNIVESVRSSPKSIDIPEGIEAVTEVKNNMDDESNSSSANKEDVHEEKLKNIESTSIVTNDDVDFQKKCGENSLKETDECSAKAQLDANTTIKNGGSLESTSSIEEDKMVNLNESIKTTDLKNIDNSNETEANVDKDIHDSEKKLKTFSVNSVEGNPEESEKNGPNMDAGIPETFFRNKTDVSKESGENESPNLELEISNKQDSESKNQTEVELKTSEKEISAKTVEKDEENKDEPTKEEVVGDKTEDDQILKSPEAVAVDSDIEIVDDSDKVGIHQSNDKKAESTAEDDQDETVPSKDEAEVDASTEVDDPIDREEGDLMIDEAEPDSDIELIIEDIVAADKDKGNAETQKESSETSENHSAVTAMDVDEVALTNETENTLESKSKADSPSEIHTDDNSNQKDEVAQNEVDKDVPETKDADDDEIIFIKECKKASDCTCVMCYKNKTPDKRDAESKSKTDAKDKTDQTSKTEEKKDKAKRPKLSEKFLHLTRKDLESLVTRMFVKAYGYEGALGSLREMVVKAQGETKTMQGLLALQGKQLKELTAIHEKALTELRQFQEQEPPARGGGTLHPLRITRNVGLQVNVAPASEKKRLSQQLSSPKSPLPSPSVSTRAALNAKLKRPITRPAGYTGGAPPQLVPAAAPGGRVRAQSPQVIPPVRRGAPATTPRPGRPPTRPMVGGGLRVLPPRALNNTGGRSPSVSPRQSPMGRLVPRSPLTTPAPGSGTLKTSGGSVDIINLDDDETSVQATKNNTKLVRSPTNTLARNPNTTIRLTNPPGSSTASNTTGSKTSQRVFVPSSQGYKIRTPVNSSGGAGTILTSLPTTSSSSTTTYVLNTEAGPIPFQTNNIRLNFRPNATGTPVRINYQGHPAPVPPTPKVPNLPSEALYQGVPGPPKLRVQLAQEGKGIQLTWSLDTPADMAPIESYQLFAYQENKAAPISPALWKNIGKLDALPLPMACTLTQFTSGHTYHFLVRAVDVFKRFSTFSNPGTIHLRT